MSNDIRIFCRPCDFEIAKQLIQAGVGVIVPKAHIFEPKYAQEQKGVGRRSDIKMHEGNSSDEPLVGMGMASCKAEGGLVHYGTGQDFRLVTEKQFLDAIVNRSNVTIEKVGRRKKHYLYDDGLFAIKHKSRFYLLASVYSAILKGEE